MGEMNMLARDVFTSHLILLGVVKTILLLKSLWTSSKLGPLSSGPLTLNLLNGQYDRYWPRYKVMSSPLPVHTMVTMGYVWPSATSFSTSLLAIFFALSFIL